MRRLILGFLPILFALGSAGSSAAQEASKEPNVQEPVPAFSAQVEQVTVDAVVTDQKGKAITGLERGDFTILEDGVPQSVSYFEAVRLPDTPAPKPPTKPRVVTNTDPVTRSGRTFVVIFDDVHTSRANGERAKAAIGEFLKKAVREGDRVTLVAAGGNAWWTSRMEEGREEMLTMLKRLEGKDVPDKSPERMSDWEAMRIQIFNDQDVSNRVIRRFINNGVMDSTQSAANVMTTTMDSDPTHVGMHNPLVDGKAAQVYSQAVERLHATLGVLKRILDSLSASKGRKALILVSDGFIMDPSMPDFKEVVQASRRANAAIYALSSVGLSSMPTDFTAENATPQVDMDVGAAFMDASLADEGNDTLASETGGFSVKNLNDLGAGIERIANESLAYYLIGYTPTNRKQDGKFRKIEVRLNRKDVQVRARKGYYAPQDPSLGPQKKKEPAGTDPQFQLALDSPYESNDIPLRMTAYVFGEAAAGKANTTVVTEVDLKNFGFKENEGRFQDAVEFLMVAAQRDTGEFWRYDQKVDLQLLPATRDRFLKSWFPVARGFELPAGAYQVKIVVRDKNTSKVGSVSYDFDVPNLNSFRVSSISLADVLQESPTDPTKTLPRPALLARRTFPAGSELYGQFSVFGAAKGKDNGMPNVSAGYQIRAADGSVKTDVPPSPIKPTSLGKVSRVIGTSLADLPPGDYDFTLSVKDEIAGATLEAHEPFTIVADQSSPTASR